MPLKVLFLLTLNINKTDHRDISLVSLDKTIATFSPVIFPLTFKGFTVLSSKSFYGSIASIKKTKITL